MKLEECAVYDRGARNVVFVSRVGMGVGVQILLKAGLIQAGQQGLL